MATHCSILAWRIPWTEKPGGLLSMGLHRVGHDWSDLACMHALEKEMATHSSILAWRIPGTEEPGGLPSMGSHRVGHDWSNLAAGAAAAWVQNVWFRDPNMIASLQNNLPVTHTSQYLWPPTVKLSCYNATNRMRQKWHCVTLRTIHKKLIITQEVGLPWGLVLGGSLS